MTDAEMKALLQRARRIAVVGLSAKADAASFKVAAYLRQQGYEVVPVNPNYAEIMGLPCYPSLSAVPGAIDIVDLFQRAEKVPPLVAEAIAIQAKAVWMQLGIQHPEAAAAASAAGLAVVMDACIKIEHARLLGR